MLCCLLLLWLTETSQIACQCTAHIHTYVHANIFRHTNVCTLACMCVCTETSPSFRVVAARHRQRLLLFLLVVAVAVPTNSYSKGRFKAGFVARVASLSHKPALLYIFFSTNQKKKKSFFFRLLLFLKDTRMWVTYEVSRNRRSASSDFESDSLKTLANVRAGRAGAGVSPHGRQTLTTLTLNNSAAAFSVCIK